MPAGLFNAPLRHDAAAAPAGAGRRAVLVAAGLIAAAAAAPVGIVALAARSPSVATWPAAVAVAALSMAAALVGLAAVLLGLEGVTTRCAAVGDAECEQAVLRIFVGTLLLGYWLAVAAATPAADGLAGGLLLIGFGLAAAWLALLHVILRPAPGPLRRHAVAIEAGLLAGFLHIGGALAAAWYPLYPLTVLYNGFRFGQRTLIASAAYAVGGFALAAGTTAVWRQQPLLTGGLLLNLLVLPAYAGVLIRALATAHAGAAAADRTKSRLVALFARELRLPLDAAIAGAGSMPVLLGRIGDVLDLAEIEAGSFAPAAVGFDLHDIANRALAVLRPQAAANGVALTLRIDPGLPYRLHGWPRQLTQILNNLVVDAIRGATRGKIRIGLDEAGRDERTVLLRITLRDDSGGDARSRATADPFDDAAPEPAAVGLAVVKRLVMLLGGRIATDAADGRGGRLAVTVPLAIDHAAAATSLDLGKRAVLVVSEDAQFAGDLAEPLNAWNADLRWVGVSDSALAYVARLDRPVRRPILIVDGRGEVLPALTFAHRAVTAGSDRAAPFVLFVADATAIDRLIDLADGEFAGLLPAPLTDRVLGNALHALPLDTASAETATITEPPVPFAVTALPEETRPSEPVPPLADTVVEPPQPVAEPVLDDEPPLVAAIPPRPPAEKRATPPSTVTPIAAHPRFAAETAAPVDVRAVEALRVLGAGSDFFREVVETFRADAHRLMQRIATAAATADAKGFGEGVQALRGCAANVGGARLCELLLSLRDSTARDLRQQGPRHVQRLNVELAQLDAVLREALAAASTG